MDPGLVQDWRNTHIIFSIGCFDPEMIQVLGAGNIGSLFALSLSRKFPVQFIMRPSTLKSYTDVSNSTVRVHTHGKTGATWEKRIRGIASSKIENPIEQLVVAVKSHDIKNALSGIKHAITPSTEILIIHNGMGIREQVQELWPQHHRRPAVGFGITDAGVKRSQPQWTFDYTGRGTCSFTFPKDDTKLKSQLMDCRELVISEHVPAKLFELQQKKKLVVNSVINPMTAILQCPNGALLSLDGLPHFSRLMQKVVNESCKILHLDRFEMWDIVRDVISKTSSNLSSMMCDVEQGRSSEIDFINGYIVESAKRQELPAPFNLMLTELVKMRILQSRHEEQSTLPLELNSELQSSI